MIGEHIDYEGYSVLVMAIRQDTIVAIRKNDAENVLRIAHVNDEKQAMCWIAHAEKVLGFVGWRVDSLLYQLQVFFPSHFFSILLGFGYYSLAI